MQITMASIKFFSLFVFCRVIEQKAITTENYKNKDFSNANRKNLVSDLKGEASPSIYADWVNGG